MPLTRRIFLQHTATAAAGVIGGSLLRFDPRLSADAALDAGAAAYDEAAIRALAHRALDAVTAAGVDYADVRINVVRMLALIVDDSSIQLVPTADASKVFLRAVISSQATIGIRALVAGVWGFAGDSILTPDGVTRVAELAVGYARDGRRLVPARSELAPAPVVPNGRWQTPIEIDPFAIPVGQYVQIYGDGLRAAGKVKGVQNGAQPSWTKSERFFASTSGSNVAQRIYLSAPDAGSRAQRGSSRLLSVEESVDFATGGYGYETFAKVDLETAWPRAAAEAARRASLPVVNAEVGQYDVVFAPRAMAGLTSTLCQSLELDRALGDKANDEGTTFAAPPLDVLGTLQVATKSVTLTADRTRPHALATVGWDEEGVPPQPFTLVEDGTIVDYITDRTNAPVLAPWYRRRGQPMRSCGCAGRTGKFQPVLRLPNLTLRPGPDTVSADDLVKDVKKGFFIEGAGPSPDQQFMNLQIGASKAREIVNGKLGREVIDLAIQATLTRLWRNIAALGGAASAELHDGGNETITDLDCLGGMGVSAVPALVHHLNVINVGKEA